MTERQCEHYQRKCSLFTPCCGKEYRCRICHDEAESHVLDRKKVEEIICLQCSKKQKVARNCIECGILFGNYMCSTCRLFDDVDKKQFHCDGCGICRVGGRENFFHCDKCNMCLGKNTKDTHKCIENISQRNCPVCMEDIHTSRQTAEVPKCGHMIHFKCMEGMFKHGQTSCPVCNHSLVDMSSHWPLIDQEIANTPMPPAYRNYHVNILCRDCHEESNVLFHIIGLKCQSCGAYNTTRIGGDDPLPEEVLENLSELSLSSEHEDSWETISNQSGSDAEDNERPDGQD